MIFHDGKDAPESLLKVLQMLDEGIAKVLDVQFLDAATAATGNRALGVAQTKQSLTAIQGDADLIEQTINCQLIPKWLEHNTYRLSGPLEIKAPRLTEQFDIEETLDRVSQLVRHGVIKGGVEIDQWARKKLRAPEIPEDLFEKRQDQEREMAENPPVPPTPQDSQDKKQTEDEKDDDKLVELAETFSRAPRPSEHVVALDEISQFLTFSETKFLNRIRPILHDYFLASAISAGKSFPDISRVKLTPPAKIRTEARKVLKELVDFGFENVIREHRRSRS